MLRTPHLGTSPDCPVLGEYHGGAVLGTGLAQACHEHGVPLVVDEAHGAHLGLHPSLPPSALQQGADVAVQSTHKQLSAMTQAAMLHVKGPRVSHAKLARALQAGTCGVSLIGLGSHRAHCVKRE